MCFFLFPKPPPKKRRYYPVDTSEEDLIPRKRRQTHYSARPVKYEPLRGHGVKRDAVKVQPSVLRGQGVKRDPAGEKRQVFSDVKPAASSKSVRSSSSKRRVEHSASRRRSHHDAQKRRSNPDARNRNSQYRTPEMTQTYQYQTGYAPANTSQYRYSYPATATREHPLYTNQTPNYVYSMPKCYYHDIGAVRAATSYALQENQSMFDAARFEANRVAYSRNLRRQPAYTQLRYS